MGNDEGFYIRSLADVAVVLRARNRPALARLVEDFSRHREGCRHRMVDDELGHTCHHPRAERCDIPVEDLPSLCLWMDCPVLVDLVRVQDRVVLVRNGGVWEGHRGGR